MRPIKTLPDRIAEARAKLNRAIERRDHADMRAREACARLSDAEEKEAAARGVLLALEKELGRAAT